MTEKEIKCLPSTTTNPVKISFSHLGEIKVDDNIDRLDVNTSGEEITADQVPTQSSSEVMEHSVSVSLSHLGVNVVAGVAKFRDFLGQKLHPLCGIAENDALNDKKYKLLH